MGPLAIAIIVAACVFAFFLVVMAFRGLLDDLDSHHSAGCLDCHRSTVLPIAISHRCWRCRHHRLGSLADHMTAHLRG